DHGTAGAAEEQRRGKLIVCDHACGPKKVAEPPGLKRRSLEFVGNDTTRQFFRCSSAAPAVPPIALKRWSGKPTKCSRTSGMWKPPMGTTCSRSPHHVVTSESCSRIRACAVTSPSIMRNHWQHWIR